MGAGDGSGLAVGTMDNDGAVDTVGTTDGTRVGVDDGTGDDVGIVGVKDGDGVGAGDPVGTMVGTRDTVGDVVGVIREGDGLGAGDDVGV